MKRLIITGSNGTGKSHVAAQIAKAWPDWPLISYDAVRLTENWIKKSTSEIAADMADLTAQDAWIIEGGPSVLGHALGKADGVIWLDPPDLLRAWRLARRPWKNLGQTRAELPEGNVDWPLQQYIFAFRSLRNSAGLRRKIKTQLQARPPAHLWHCRNRANIDAMLRAIAQTVHLP